METYEDRFPKWYEHIKAALEILRDKPGSRENAVVITMLEQALAYAWLFIVSK